MLCNDLLTSLYLIMVKNTPATNGLRCGQGCLSKGSAWCCPASAVQAGVLGASSVTG